MNKPRTVEDIVIDTVLKFADNHNMAISDHERMQATIYSYKFIMSTEDRLPKPVQYYKDLYLNNIK